MPIKYAFDSELQNRTNEIALALFPHVKINQMKCFRSIGSSSKNTIARCHTMGKLMQMTVGVPPHYGIEFLSEQFDRLSRDEQDKVIIHELMHIPKSFGGGFRHHDYVCDRNIEEFHKKFKRVNNEFGINIFQNEVEQKKNESKKWW